MVPDIIEKILINLDVRDLLRFKTVCKSWLSLISSADFIKSHLNLSYNKYYTSNESVHRRMLMYSLGCRFNFSYQVDDLTFDFHYCHIVGSCNGLVCVSPSDSQVLVIANPSTRQLINVKKPQIPDIKSSLCWGFGYDSSNDDYKVVLGLVMKGRDRTCFQVLSLKSNVWKFVGEVEYYNVDTSKSNVGGMLCNGAIHWFMKKNRDDKKVILCFDLSKEEFKEIPQPDDARYEFTLDDGLETIGDCLCIFRRWNLLFHRWVMKNDNGEQFWELLPPVTPMLCKRSSSTTQYVFENDNDGMHYLQMYQEHNRYSPVWLPMGPKDFGAPVYVPSLVSPHLHWLLKRKMQTLISKRNVKLTKGGPTGS